MDLYGDVLSNMEDEWTIDNEKRVKEAASEIRKIVGE